MNSLGIEVGTARQGSPRCPFCREDLADLPACECSTCAVGYHLECAQELPSCATVGCAGTFRARCPGCDEDLDLRSDAACKGCGRVYHPRCRTQAETCACGASLPGEGPILRARRDRGENEVLGHLVTAYQVLILLVVAAMEIWAMIEVTSGRRGGAVQQSPMLFMLAPLILGPLMVSLPYLLGWKNPD